MSTLLTTIPSSLQPKPTKRELLEAAALALSKENAAHNEALDQRIDKARKAFNKAVEKIARKQLKDSKVSVVRHFDGGVSVEFTVELESLDPATDKLHLDLKAALSQKQLLTNPATILKDLQKRSKASSRVPAILALPGAEKALAEAARGLLEGKESL